VARKAIPKGVRFDVFKRDRFTCVYCGATPPGVLLHVDHVIAVANGGGNGIDNLVTACQPCNLGKSDKPLDVIPRTLKQKAADAAEREAQVIGYQQILSKMRSRIEDEAWEVADYFNDQLRPGTKTFPTDWLNSVKMFIEKMGHHEVLTSMQLAVGRKPYSAVSCFKYFCGICWNKARKGEVPF